jgi:cytochrome P450
VTPYPSDPHDHASASPPPGCPAHTGAARTGAPQRMWGPDVDADPMAFYEELRQEYGSVAPVLLPGGDLPAWLVLGWRENAETMRNPLLFTRDPRQCSAVKEGKIGPGHPLAPLVDWQPLCNLQDGEEQQRLRGAVTRSLRHYDRYGLRSLITRHANVLINEFCSDGKADLVEQYARQLPLRVVTHLLGMPDAVGPDMAHAARDMLSGSPTAVASNNFITDHLTELVERKQADGQQGISRYDIASWLIKPEAKMTFTEVVEHTRLLLIAANETTSNLLASTLAQVLSDRDVRGGLAGGTVTQSELVAHTLRVHPPFTTVIARYATADTRLGKQLIKSGDILINNLAAANVDPRVQPPREERAFGNSSHLSYSTGPHECPGRDIGEAITEVGADVLLERLQAMRLADPHKELRWNSTLMSMYLDSLPVEFDQQKPKQRLLAKSGR